MDGKEMREIREKDMMKIRKGLTKRRRRDDDTKEIFIAC
jgi:hypothetical protein